MDIVFPSLGPGFDMFIFDKIFLFGEATWLDFTYNNRNPVIRSRELHAGVRLELVEHAHIALEFLAVQLKVVKGHRREFNQQVVGPHIFVQIAF